MQQSNRATEQHFNLLTLSKFSILIAFVFSLVAGMSLTAKAETTVDYQTFFVDGIKDAQNFDVVAGTGGVNVTSDTTNTRGVTWDAEEKCAVFDGEAYLVISNPLKNASASTGFTITMEAYISSENNKSGTYIRNIGVSAQKNGWQRLFDLSDGSIQKYLYINAGSAGHLRYAVATQSNDNQEGVTPGGSYYDAWHTYTLVVKPGGNMYLYVDGTQISSMTSNATVISALDLLSSFNKCYIGTSVYETTTDQYKDGFFIGKIRGFSTISASDVFILTYNSNGGTEFQSVATPAIPGNLPTPTKANYAFEGWYMDSALTQQATSGTKLTQSTTLYAKWTPAYTVTYTVAHGTWADNTTGNKTETVAKGSKPADVPTGMIPSEGYTGGSWDTNPAEATITGATTFTYTFTEKPAVKQAPTAKTLTYTGSAQELVDAGEADPGTMQYALGEDETTAPAADWTKGIPTGTEVKTYYVWYKAVDDATETATDPAGPVTVTIAQADDPNYKVPTGLTATYGKTLADVTLPTGWKWEDAGTTSVGAVGENTFKATFTPTDTANYKTVTGVSVTVTVKAAPKTDVAVTSVTLNTTSTPLTVGKTLTLTATVMPDNATDKTVTWTSSNPGVATVENGRVTAIAEGTTIITATAGGKSATCEVTVKKPEEPSTDKEAIVIGDDTSKTDAQSLSGYFAGKEPEDLNKIKTVEFTGSESLASLEGIKTLKNVEKVKVTECKNLQSADLSGLTELKEVDMSHCTELKELDVSGCTELTSLDVSVSGIDLLKIDNCPKLTSVDCHYNSLGYLDVGGKIPNLKSLICYGQTKEGLEPVQSGDRWVAPLAVYATPESELESGTVRLASVENIIPESVKGYKRVGLDDVEIETKYSNGIVSFASRPEWVEYNYDTKFQNISMDVTVMSTEDGSGKSGSSSSGCGNDPWWVLLLAPLPFLF